MKNKELFEFEVTTLGTISYNGEDYNYEAEISGGMDTEPCYVVQVHEHGLNTDVYTAIKRKIIDKLSKGKVVLSYE